MNEKNNLTYNFFLIIFNFLKTSKVISSFVIISKNSPKKLKTTNISPKAMAKANIVVILNEEIKNASNGFRKK